MLKRAQITEILSLLLYLVQKFVKSQQNGLYGILQQGSGLGRVSPSKLYIDMRIDGIMHASVVVTFGKNWPFFRQ